jgi:hypothetical protein
MLCAAFEEARHRAMMRITRRELSIAAIVQRGISRYQTTRPGAN